MDDYDVFNELHNKNIVISGIDDGYEYIITKYFLSNELIEFMPIRFSYDLDNFTNEYITNTKKLFTYYYNKNNTYKNELLKLKKHFIHYQRNPIAVFIPKKCDCNELRKLFQDLGITILTDKKDILHLLEKLNLK